MKKLIMLSLLILGATPIAADNYCSTVKGSFLTDSTYCSCNNNVLKGRPGNKKMTSIKLTRPNMIIKVDGTKYAVVTNKKEQDKILNSKNFCNTVKGGFWTGGNNNNSGFSATFGSCGCYKNTLHCMAYWGKNGTTQDANGWKKLKLTRKRQSVNVGDIYNEKVGIYACSGPSCAE